MSQIKAPIIITHEGERLRRTNVIPDNNPGITGRIHNKPSKKLMPKNQDSYQNGNETLKTYL